MIRIVVPTDFSETSRNAVSYALRLAGDVANSQVILFNSFDKVVAGSDGTPMYNDPEIRKNLSLVALNSLRSELGGDTVNVETVAEEGTLIGSLSRMQDEGTVDLIVMGMNGATRLEQILIGSSTLNVINQAKCPVLIIPPDARYSKIDTVVYASDMKNVAETTPADSLRKILGLFRPKLYVVNVNEEHYVELSEEYKKERADMDRLLDGFEPDYAFIRLYDFTEAINQFAIDRKADMIITVPRKHGFLDRVFATSHTEKLAYHTHIPLLAIHE